MFVFDANTVLAIERHSSKGVKLDESQFRLLLETRKRVHRHWKKRSRYIPVEPVLAVMELTRQDRVLDFQAYLERFTGFFDVVYGIDDLDPVWIRSVYEPVSHLIDSVHLSIRQTLEKILVLSPTVGSLSPGDILKRIDSFLEWVTAERENLTIVGGPLLQLAVYSIAGSPNAHRFLKLQRVPKEGVVNVARNVAWDVMHWINLDFHYHYAKYAATVVCSSDQALIEFLLVRRNLGPRAGREAMASASVVDSHGKFDLPVLTKLDDSALGDRIAQRLSQFWQQMSQTHQGELWFMPLNR
jgi:hypothetical protein